MKSSVPFLSLSLCSMLGWAQGTVSAPPPPPPASQLKVRGPETIAQQDPNRVVATINGQQITAQQAVNLLKAVPAEQRRNANLENVVERVYMIQQLADEAGKLNLDQQPPWKDELQFSRQNILAQAYINRLSASPGPSSDEARRYYDAHPNEFDQAKISGILVSFAPPGTPASSSGPSRTEDQARQKAEDLEKKIKAGADFATLARSDSDNQQSAAHGGDLGSLTPETPNIPPDIKNAVFKLQPGQVSEPIRVPNGFYILKLTSRAKVPFEQARSSIIVKQEFDKYKIQVKDPEFFNASSAPGPNIPSLQKPAISQPSEAGSKPSTQH